MEFDQKQIVNKLYWKQGLSAREVGEQLNLTVWQVIKFMRKHKIPRRSQAETRKIQFNNSPLSYHKKKNLTQSDQKLQLAGLMLYWAEGAKSGRDCVDFANSDSNMVKLFLSMLRNIYHVDETRLRVLLYCFSNQNTASLLQYWSKLLNISIDQFTKPYVRNDFDPRKIGRMKYGLVHIRYNDKRLLVQIKDEIAKIQQCL